MKIHSVSAAAYRPASNNVCANYRPNANIKMSKFASAPSFSAVVFVDNNSEKDKKQLAVSYLGTGECLRGYNAIKDGVLNHPKLKDKTIGGKDIVFQLELYDEPRAFYVMPTINETTTGSMENINVYHLPERRVQARAIKQIAEYILLAADKK